jgi:hypothetical protein
MGQMLRVRAYEMALLGGQDNCDAALFHVLEGRRELGPDLGERLQKNPGTRQRQGVKVSLTLWRAQVTTEGFSRTSTHAMKIIKKSGSHFKPPLLKKNLHVYSAQSLSPVALRPLNCPLASPRYQGIKFLEEIIARPHPFYQAPDGRFHYISHLPTSVFLLFYPDFVGI